MSSGAPALLGRQKKEWVRCWEGVAAMGVALYGIAEGCWQGNEGGLEVEGLNWFRKCQKSNSRLL